MKKILSTLILSLFLINLVSAGLELNLKSYYKLDGTSGDVIDSANLVNLTNNGATRGLTGQINNSFYFDGLNDELGKKLPSILQNESLTLNLWTNATTTSGDSWLLELGDSAVADNYIRQNANKFSIAFNSAPLNATSTITTGTWYMITAVRNPALNQIEIYINGQNEANATNGTLSFGTNPSIVVGSRNGSGYYDGNIDEIGIWTRALSPSEITDLYNAGAGKAYPFTTVSLISPTNNSRLAGVVDFNASINPLDTHNITNSTIYIYNSSEDLVIKQVNLMSGSSKNSTIFSINNLTVGNYTWNAEFTTINSTDLLTAFGDNNLSIQFDLAQLLNVYYNESTFETAFENLKAEIKHFDSDTLSNPKIYYNGSQYTGTLITDTNTSNISLNLDIPLIKGNRDFFFSIDVNGENYNTSTNSQEVNSTFFIRCNATFSTQFLNISFKDEDNLLIINASIPSSTFEYYLGSGTVNKSLNYIENTNYFNHTFCANPTDRIFNVNSNVQYKQDTAYPQRTWDIETQSYNGTTVTNQFLYLLGILNGNSVTIQVLNPQEQVLSDVMVTVTRVISGDNVIVASGVTADTGSVNFFLNPDYVHTFTFEKSGISTLVTSFAPTEAEYTVTMGAGLTSQNSTFQGIERDVLPKDTYLVNDTSYNFGFALNSSFWDIDEYGFYMRYSNGSITTAQTTTTSGTLLTDSVNTNNQSIIYMDYYWIINGNYTNATNYWIIQNTANTGWSISTFFTDLNSYLDSGFFGIDDFGKKLLIFLILIISIGIMNYKFGITSPLAVMTTIFGVVFFFDVALGLIPTIRGIPNLPTYLTGLILILASLQEASRR